MGMSKAIIERSSQKLSMFIEKVRWPLLLDFTWKHFILSRPELNPTDFEKATESQKLKSKVQQKP